MIVAAAVAAAAACCLVLAACPDALVVGEVIPVRTT